MHLYEGKVPFLIGMCAFTGESANSGGRGTDPSGCWAAGYFVKKRTDPVAIKHEWLSQTSACHVVPNLREREDSRIPEFPILSTAGKIAIDSQSFLP